MTSSFYQKTLDIPFIMGCDLNSHTDCAAFDLLSGKDIFGLGTVWFMPRECSEESMELYKLIEKRFLELRDKNQLSSLNNKLRSAYFTCTYEHGQHSSKVATCYSNAKKGMNDHILYTPHTAKVLKLLEIPDEQKLAPAATVQGSHNYVSLLPNEVFPSNHLRLEAVFELLP